MKHHSVALIALLFGVGRAQAAPNLIKADGSGGTYPLLEKSYGIEVPDCGHAVPHITEAMDSDLGRPVFVFHLHAKLDDDRCGKTDRQRTELRGRAGGVQGPEGSTVFYRWMFKLPAGFKTSGNFTHIFQIKAYGNGHGSGSPIMTLTPRNDTFGIDGRIGRRGTTDLEKFLDEWVVVNLRIVHAHAGRVEMTIRRERDGAMLFSHSGNADMFDEGAGYGAPKFGIYRSLANRDALRDEQVRFADFCVSKTSAKECESATSSAFIPDGLEPALPDDETIPLDDTTLATDDPTFSEADLRVFEHGLGAGCRVDPAGRTTSAPILVFLLVTLLARKRWLHREAKLHATNGF